MIEDAACMKTFQIEDRGVVLFLEDENGKTYPPILNQHTIEDESRLKKFINACISDI